MHRPNTRTEGYALRLAVLAMPMLMLAWVIAPAAHAAPVSGGPSDAGGDARSPAVVEPESAAAIEVVRIRITGVVNLQNRQVHRYMNVEGQVTLDDDADIVGVMYGAVVTEALDEQGRDLLTDVRDEIEMMRANRSYNATMPRHSGDRTLRIAATVRSMPRVPTRLKRLRGQTMVLVADRRATVAVTPVAPGKLIDVHSGMRVQITDVRQEGGRVTVTLDFESTDPSPFFNPNSAPPFVAAVDLIDDQGNALPQQGVQPNIKAIEQGVARGEAKMMFGLPEGRRPQTLRFDVVSRTSDRVMRFDVSDIKLPGAEADAPADGKIDPPAKGRVQIEAPADKPADEGNPNPEPRVQE